MKKFIRIVMIILNVVCALALVVATLTVWVAPSQMVLPSVMSYATPYLFVINALWVILWLCFTRWEFLISLVVIVARIGIIPQYLQFSGTSDVAADERPTLKVMTFNVHGFRGPDEQLPADTGAMWFVEMLRTEKPDIISVEEFFQPNSYRLIDTLTSMGYRYQHGVRDRLAGVVLFSKFPIAPDKRLNESQQMCNDIDWQGHTIRMVSVHLGSYQLTHDESHDLSSFTYTDTNARRIFHKTRSTVVEHEQSWKEVLQPLIAQSDYPIVVCGDFNDTPASYLYQQFTKMLRDAFTEQGQGYCTTYRGGLASFRIDHLFCSDSLEVLAYKRIDSDISDHYPVCVVLGWRSE